MSRASDALRLLRRAPRPVASWLLLVIGALLLFAGQFAFWAADALVDSAGFTERAVRTLDDEDVQAFVSHFLVEDLIEQGEPSLIAGRPLIEAAVQAVLGSSAFEQLYETAVRQTHRTLFSDDPIVLQLVDASIAVEVTLASFSPELADSLPSLDGAVVELADSEVVNTTLAISRGIRFLAALLPLLALAAFAASWAVARGRRRALIRIGITVAIVAALTIVTLDVGKAALEEFAGGGLRGAAAAGVWDAFLGDLRAWNFTLGAGGLVLAAAPQLASLDVGELLMRAWRLATAPQSNAGRLVRAIAAVVLGSLALFRTDDFVTVVVALAGLAAIYLGLIELMRLLWKERATTAGDVARAAASAELRPQLSPGVRIAALVVLIAGGVVAIVLLIAGLGLSGGGCPRTGGGLQRPRRAMQPPAQRGRLRGHAQLDVGGLGGLAVRRPPRGDRRTVGLRHPRAVDRRLVRVPLVEGRGDGAARQGPRGGWSSSTARGWSMPATASRRGSDRSRIASSTSATASARWARRHCARRWTTSAASSPPTPVRC